MDNKKENIENTNVRPWVIKLKKLLGMLINKKTNFITSDEAYRIATYGTNIQDNDIVLHYQKRINTLIRDKIMSMSRFENSYYCVIDFERCVEQYIDDIIEPFKERGFKFINISKKIDEIKDSNVYLISWKNKNEK